MQLDVRTLIVLTSLCALMMGAGVFLVADCSSPLTRPLRWWGAGCLLYGVSWFLIALRDTAPDLVSIVLAHALMAMALLCDLTSIYEFAGKRLPRLLYLLVPFTGAFSSFFTYVVPSYNGRLTFLSLGSALILTFCAARLWRFDLNISSRAQKATSLVFAVAGLIAGCRGVEALVHLHQQVPLNSPSAFGTLYYCGNLLCVVMVTFGVVLVSHERANAQLQRLATVDALTGTWNRATIERLASAAMEKARRTNTPISLVVGDIDHFKTINDTLGHAGGDRALHLVARTLEEALRSGDHLGRYGGEEFLIVAPATEHDEAVALANRLCQAVAARQFEGLSGVTISLGVATSTPEGEGSTPEGLFRQADAALYAAKAAGRNRVEAFASPSVRRFQTFRRAA